MNRRAAMLLTLLSGGWLTRRAWGRSPFPQDGDPPSEPGSRPLPRSAPNANANPNANPGGTAADSKATGAADPDNEGEGAGDESAEPAGNFPGQPGHQFRAFDIARYTKLRHTATNPEKEIVKWLRRRTSDSVWFGAKAASLSADANEVRVYHNAKIVRQVGELIDRFVNAKSDIISIRVRFVSVSDRLWRYNFFARMKPVAAGPQGQQAWLTKNEDAGGVISQITFSDPSAVLFDQNFQIINGQALFIDHGIGRSFTSGIQREGPAGFGSKPVVKEIKEGVVLSASPLLHFDDPILELALDLKAVTVKSLLRTRVIGPRNVGPPEISIDVPEVIESRMETMIEEWPLTQSVIISMGILPNILRVGNGIGNAFRRLNNPNTELLVFLNAETYAPPRVSRRNREP